MIGVSHHCAIVYRLRTKRAGDFGYMTFEPREDGRPPWCQVFIDDPAHWHVCEVEIRPPSVVAATFPADAQKPVGCALVPLGAPMKLLKQAAKHAFRQLSVEHLRALVNDKGWTWPRPKPRSEFGLAFFAIKCVEPDLDEQAITERIRAMRGASPSVEWNSVLNEVIVESLDGLLDKDDVRDARQHVQQKELKRTLKKAKAAAKSGARGSGASSSASSKERPTTRIKHVVNLHSFTREEVLCFLPKMKGVSITRDGKRHMRWTCSYLADEPPYSKSCVWNEHISESSSVLTVLKWCWEEHSAHTGEECPWVDIPPHACDARGSSGAKGQCQSAPASRRRLASLLWSSSDQGGSAE